MITEAFAARAARPATARRLRPVYFLQLLVGEWRADPADTAVCGLNGPRPLRVLLRSLLAVTAGIVVLRVVLWPVALVVGWPGAILAGCAIVVAAFPTATWSGLMGWRAHWRLHKARPRGVVVHSVASTVPGRGAALLEALNAEADRRCWVLTLDATGALADYYTELGYKVVGAPVAMPGGTVSVPMARPALRRQATKPKPRADVDR